LLGFLDGSFRGLGQIVFANSAASGALVLAGMLAASAWLGAGAFVGVVSATATARWLRLDSGRTSSGLYGYNGALVGAVFATLLAPTWGWSVLVAIAFAAAVSTVIMVATSNVVVGVLGLPPLTLPFNLVALPCVLFSLATSKIPHVASLGVPATPLAASAAASSVTALELLSATLRGIGQIVLADSVTAGVLILLGIALVSRRGAAFALVGSLIGALLGFTLGADKQAVLHGLRGYNAFVAAQAVGGVFLSFTWRSAVYALAAAVTATVLHGALSVAFGPLGAPGLTLPFCLTTFAFLLATRSTPLFESVRMSEVSSGEDP
jgi:urea transporter